MSYPFSDETQKRITILPGKLKENEKVRLSKIFGEKTVPINHVATNELLVKCSPRDLPSKQFTQRVGLTADTTESTTSKSPANVGGKSQTGAAKRKPASHSEKNQGQSVSKRSKKSAETSLSSDSGESSKDPFLQPQPVPRVNASLDSSTTSALGHEGGLSRWDCDQCHLDCGTFGGLEKHYETTGHEPDSF